MFFGCVRPKGLCLAACPERAGRLLAAAILAPRMHDQRQRNHAVADEHAEILADGRVAEEVLAGRRGENEHQVEQHAADERLRIGRADHGSAADQNRRARVQADLLVRAVGLEGAHVLHEDELTPAREDRGEHDGDGFTTDSDV